MEILEAYGITDREVKKISSELSISIEELNSLKEFLSSENAPLNLVEVYSNLERDVNAYLKSPKFIDDAKKAGVKLIGGINVDEDIIIEEAPKVTKTLREIAREKRAKAKGSFTEQVVKEEPIEEPIEESGEEIDLPESEVKELINGIKLYKSQSVSGGGITALKELAALISYGGSDYKLHQYLDSQNYLLNYKLELPNSSAKIIISIPKEDELEDLNKLWERYLTDKSSAIYLIGNNKEEVNALSLMLTVGSAYGEREEMSKEDLSSSFMESDNYEEVNTEYSEGLFGVSFYEVFNKIEMSWKAQLVLEEPLYDDDTSTLDYCTYGIRYSDYIYKSKESYYVNGGNTIVTNRVTFVVPKGLTKNNQFAETGGHINDPNISKIDIKKFKKDAAIGKKFQTMSGKLDKSIDCRIIGSSNNKYSIASKEGDYFLINKLSFNYFKKYYSQTDLEIKLSDNMAFIMLGSNIVGMIPAESKPLPSIVGIFDSFEQQTLLRNLDTNTYNVMTSFDEEIEESIEEDEEIVAEGESLIVEFEAYLETIYEYYEEAKEEGISNNILKEFLLELDFIIDSLEELYEEIGNSKAIKKLEDTRKILGL